MLFAKKARLAAKSDLYRKFLAKKILRDVPKFAKAQWEDFDPDDVLRYVGLTTYKPVRSSFAGIGAFIIGCAVGGIAALMLTPKTGPELRNNVKDKAMGYLGKQGISVGQEKTASA
ncbi:YtxH domain-containing protein [Vitiosangium sp. GDMCC 1.1324]|uniref:YtxH domain-containing protein n=1 Tax=Vitiosangium sp. (strain GDMCC 1.1324) TaxID=2138576 RepID=UPI000D36E1D2|nr:YtxH domain-containing protein [Vitiosangium sp. GDMCC 1.1324]PTL85885.1 YtxH domain-containing protein [Vitiosangium sp. GDMCC 1.1324]